MASWYESTKTRRGKATVIIFDDSSTNSRICKCNATMKIQMSRKSYSYGRRFFSCPNAREGVGGCDFFLWFDLPEGYGFKLNEVIMQELKNELNEVKIGIKNASEQIKKHGCALICQRYIIISMLVVFILSKMM
ncbi:hypothetical protein ACFE04_022687 [Oxalis oulophora]